MDYTSIRLENAYCFLNDILIVSEGSEENHTQYVFNCRKRPDEENLGINLSTCFFAKLEIGWLGYHILQSNVWLIKSKNKSTILSPGAPKTLKKLCSFLGSVHYLSSFIPYLARMSHPLRRFIEKTY